MTEYVSRGDPRRSLELLWGLGPARTRGPKPGLSLEAIVVAATELVEAEGLDALSMRKVADRLGKSSMSLYTYVPGKGELLELMLDRVLGELVVAHPLDDGWRAAVEASARDGWAFYERHPWVLQISGSRSSLGPNELGVYESQLRLVDGLGLSGVEMARVVGTVHGYVRGAAQAVSDARTAEQATGMSDDDWWNARSPVFEELSAQRDVTADPYPTITKLANEQAFDQLDRADGDATPYTVRDALDTFEFGLQRVLDGIEAYLARRPS